jgi:ABC-type lipoprotein release transport system permease subunit|tara:strand:+ start:147 stop:386 length:240 start_codon:yes stop_codon:yes gene_type:complete
MDIAIIGWVWLGILIGVIAGFVLCSWLTSSKVAEMDAEISHHMFVRDSLKEEIFRLENQTKPQPRKRRNIKVNKIKVGE